MPDPNDLLRRAARLCELRAAKDLEEEGGTQQLMDDAASLRALADELELGNVNETLMRCAHLFREAAFGREEGRQLASKLTNIAAFIRLQAPGL